MSCGWASRLDDAPSRPRSKLREGSLSLDQASICHPRLLAPIRARSASCCAPPQGRDAQAARAETERVGRRGDRRERSPTAARTASVTCGPGLGGSRPTAPSPGPTEEVAVLLEATRSPSKRQAFETARKTDRSRHRPTPTASTPSSASPAAPTPPPTRSRPSPACERDTPPTISRRTRSLATPRHHDQITYEHYDVIVNDDGSWTLRQPQEQRDTDAA